MGSPVELSRPGLRAWIARARIAVSGGKGGILRGRNYSGAVNRQVFVLANRFGGTKLPSADDRYFGNLLSLSDIYTALPCAAPVLGPRDV